MPHNYTELTTSWTDANKAAFWKQYNDYSDYNKSFREWYEEYYGDVAFGQKDFAYDFKQYPNGVKKLFTDDPVEQEELVGGSVPAWNKIPTQTLNIITHTFKIDYGKYIGRYATEFEEF